MADRDSERDRRVRELLSGKKKDQMAVLGQSRAEVQDIQSELQNHIALQQAQDQARLQQAQTISQAAGGMLAMEEGNQLQGQVASMNPQTQATLGKYGVKPGRSQNTTRNQSGGRTVSKSGDITNIKNETITNNRTEIKVTQPTIPMSQPNIPVQAATHKKEDNTAKFKAWLSGMFAKQQNEAEIQKKEYRKKEWNLGRTTSRLMKRIEESTTALGQKLDPRNMTSTLGGQLKWLLLIFGATMIAKVWKPTMKFLANLEGGFRAVFGLPMNTDLQNASSGTLSVIDQIKDFIGIKKGEDTSLIGGIGRVFMEGIDKLIDKLKFWFEDRATALRDVEFPSFDTPDFGPLGKVMAPIMEGLTDTFKGMTQYLGDLITVALGGSKGKVKIAARKISRQAQDVFTDTSGKKTSVGDEALIKGSGRNYMRKSDYDSFGNLKSNASSTQAMSQSLISMFNDRSGKAHTAEISTGIGQLFDVADRSGKVVISPELLGYLGLTQADVTDLRKNKYLRQEKYRIIGVKPTTDAQREEMGAYTGSAGFWGGGVAGTLGGAWAGAKAGAALGTFVGPWGTVIGGIGGGLIGGATGGYLGSAGGAAADEVIKRWTTNGLYPKIVPSESHEVGDDGSPGVPKMMWVLTKKGADIVTQKFTKEMTNKDMDITNKEFYDKIRRIEERRKRSNGVSGPITQNLSTNDLNVAQANYAAYNQRYYDKFVSTNPNSENMQNYGHYNTAMGNISGMISNFGSAASTWMHNAGNFVVRERIGKKEQNQRAMYIINRFMKEGLSEEQAAGIAANIMKESGFRANVKVMDNNHKYAGGLVGWNGPNLERVERYFGKDIRQVPFEDQVEYLVKELKGEVDGIKAVNRDGYASRFGFRTGANVLDVMKRTGNVSEATVTFERIFEGSGDYKGYTDKNGIRRGGDGNRMRIEYGLGFLKWRQSNPNSGTDYKSSPIPQINLSDLQGSEVKEKKIIGACWIGDSQSCVDKGAFPILVGQGLGCLFYFYARGSANATHYLGRGNTKNLSSPVGNIPGVASCKEALDWIIQGKPKYCFIELGHNGMNGYQELVNKLQSSGIKVICIKMWSTQAAPGTGMRSYTKEQASGMYKNIKADGFIDLTQIDIPKSKDGVHASSQGCIIAAREVLNQLSGGKPTSGSDDEDYLKTQDGLFGSLSGAIGGALDWVGDKLGGENSDTESTLKNIKLTEEQQKTVSGYQKFITTNNDLNSRSLERLGAKTDKTGTYFEIEGGYRGYIDPNSTSGILGIDSSDIQFVAKLDKNGKLTSSEIEHEEIEAVKNSVAISVGSLATNYEGKNSGSNDFMMDNSGKKIFFPLGTFSDLNFKEPAMADFADIGGKISYFIYPSKDRARTTMVGIAPGYKSSPQRIKSTHVIYGNWAREGLNKENSSAIVRYYGPIIYHKGATWIKWGHLESDRVYTEYQPLAEYQGVWLTPQALKARVELFNLLSLGKITKDSMGNLINESGDKLTKEQIEKAAKYGIISSTSHSYGEGDLYYTYDTKENVNQAQELASTILKDSAINGIKDYLLDLGISEKNTDKDIKNFYEKNKDLFEVVNGKLLSVNGLQFGTVGKDGNITFSDYNTIVNSNGDKKTLDSNLRELKNIKASRIGNIYGITDLNKAVDFMSESEKVYRNLTTEDYESMKGDRKTYTQNKFVTVPDYLEGSYGQRIPIKYNIYYNEDGTIAKVTASKEQVTKFLKGIYGDEVDYGIPISSTDSQDPVYDIKKKFVELANKFKKDRNLHTNILGIGKIKDPSKFKTGYSSLLDQILKDNKSNQEIRSIDYTKDGYAYVTYEDGTESKFGIGSISEDFYGNDVNKEYILKQLNESIKERKDNKYKLARQKAFQGSDLAAYYRTIADQINTGQITEGVEYKEDGTVWLNGKQVGTSKEITEKNSKGKETKKRVVSGLSDYKVAIRNAQQDINSSPAAKISMLKRLFGAVVEGGNLYVYSKAKDENGHPLTRVMLDPSISIDDNMKSDLKTFTKKVEYWNGESWSNIKSEGGYREMAVDSSGQWKKYVGGFGWMHSGIVDQTTAYNQIIAGIQNDTGVNKKEDVNTAILQEMNENLLESNELYNLQLDNESVQIIEQAKAQKLQRKQLAAEEMIANNTDPTKTADQIAEMAEQITSSLNSDISAIDSIAESRLARKSNAQELRKFTYTDENGKKISRYYDPSKMTYDKNSKTFTGTTLTGETITTKNSFAEGKTVTINVGGDTRTGIVNNYYPQKRSGDSSMRGSSTGDS